MCAFGLIILHQLKLPLHHLEAHDDGPVGPEEHLHPLIGLPSHGNIHGKSLLIQTLCCAFSWLEKLNFYMFTKTSLTL